MPCNLSLAKYLLPGADLHCACQHLPFSINWCPAKSPPPFPTPTCTHTQGLLQISVQEMQRQEKWKPERRKRPSNKKLKRKSQKDQTFAHWRDALFIILFYYSHLSWKLNLISLPINRVITFPRAGQIYPMAQWHTFIVSQSSCCCLFKYVSPFL